MFERVAYDKGKLSADSLFKFMGGHPAETDEAQVTREQCFALIKTWEGKLDQGFLTLTDFNQLVLPQDNSTLRANCAQRERVADQTSKRAEFAFASLIRLERDLVWTA